VPWDTEKEEDVFQREIRKIRRHLDMGEDRVDGEPFVYACTRVCGTGPAKRSAVILDSNGKTEMEILFVSGDRRPTVECTHKDLICPCVMATLMTRLA
jgi:prolyl-tRNA editing enzyme YbaK/EbsC (Cys-tRNA(Pro) deacylase)